MKYLLALLAPSACLAAALPGLSSRQNEASYCDVLSGGPGEDAKQKVGDFFRQTYITGKACPQGEDDIEGPYNFINWCGVCDGAALYFNNGHSDISKVCFTEDDFNKAFDAMIAGGQSCGTDMKKDPYLQLLYGNTENFDGGGQDPCTNVC